MPRILIAGPGRTSACLAAGLLAGCTAGDASNTGGAAQTPGSDAIVRKPDPVSPGRVGPPADNAEPPAPGPLPDFVEKGIAWLVKAQHPDGGWGGGSHADQSQRDPHRVSTDPATTAFSALALLRAGHTPVVGAHRDAVRRATEYLVKTVETHPGKDPLITDQKGTQPQSKLGPIVDTVMTAQFLARVLPVFTAGDPLGGKVDAALGTCIAKLHASQQKDGSWNLGGGWAPVLQSSAGATALELAKAAGKPIDEAALTRAKGYQKGNYDVRSSRASGAAAAGVELYANAGAQRGNAVDAWEADKLLKEAKNAGRLPAEAPPSPESFERIGLRRDRAEAAAAAVVQNESQIRRLDDEQLLAGFGNNGGEEYLSYLMTGESLVITGGEAWTKWNAKMHERLAKIQGADGSWTGHHCITSPVFCTAAVVQCLTTDRDAPTLRRIAVASAGTGDGSGGGK